jgi:hypothetical protein
VSCNLLSRQLGNGSSLKSDDPAGCYAIIRYNSRTYESAGVLVVVRGKETADSELKRFEQCQDSADRHEGWRYFIEETDLKAGTAPAEANRHRQAKLEARESKAMKEGDNGFRGSPTHRG